MVPVRGLVAGVTEVHAGESITTRFMRVGVFVFPVATYYQHAGEPIELPDYARSARLGLLQLYSSFLVLVCAAVGCAMWGLERWAALCCLATAVACAPLAWYAWRRMGAADPAQLARRDVLRQTVGLGALPEWLPRELLVVVRRQLKAEWEELRRDWGESRDWREAARRGARDPRAARLLASLAAYEHAWEDSPASLALNESAWERLARPAAPRDAAAPTPPARPRIPVRCGRCRTTNRVPARHGGARIRCRCGEALLVPSVGSAALSPRG